MSAFDGRFVEIMPVNPMMTRREFVHVDQIKRIYHEGPGDTWSALLLDDTYVMFDREAAERTFGERSAAGR